MDIFEFRKRRLSLIKPLIHWKKHNSSGHQISGVHTDANSSSVLITRGDAGGEPSTPKSPAVLPPTAPTTSSSGRESSLSNASTIDLSSTPCDLNNLSSTLTFSSTTTTTTTPKNTKVERRPSGASKFLRSLRSATSKESKEQINAIALKELDGDYSHTLSPEGRGHNPGYSSTAHRNPNKSPLEITRSQSFQEKRLLVSTSKCIATPTANPLNTATPTNGQIKVKHSRAQSFVCNNNSNSTPHPPALTPKLYLLKQQQLLRQQNIYSVPKSPPQNVNGLPAPTAQSPLSPVVKCETIYENLEVIREQNNAKIAPPTNPPPFPAIPTMAIELDNSTASRRPLLLSRKLTKDSGYETNYSDYMNIDKAEESIYSNPSNLEMRSLTNTGENSHKSQGKCDGNNGNDMNGHGHLVSGHENATNGSSRKLRRSISEVPSERSLNHLFPKMQLQQQHYHQKKMMQSARAIYSSIGNGLSIWKLDKQPQANKTSTPTPGDHHPLSKSGSGSSLYTSCSNNTLYHSLSSVTPRRSPYPPSTPTPPTVYSTLPRNHNSTLKSNNFYPPPPSASAILHSHKNAPGPSTPIPPPLSPARSTPNLIGSSNKLQLQPQNPPQVGQRHPVYREPPIYTPVNSLGRIRRPQNSPHPQTYFPSRSRSSENVKVLELLSDSAPIYGNCRKLSTSSNSSTSTLEPPSPSASAKSESTQSVQHSNTTRPSESEPAPPPEQGSNMSKKVGATLSSSSSWLKDSSSSSANSAPVRDSSSLKHIRYGPGHEKYPSWPIPAASAAEVDPSGEQANAAAAAKLSLNSSPSSANSGSVRSKSWTDQTDYPKEKVPSYARPYMKKMNQAYTHQLKTVMEKGESYNNNAGGDKSLKLARGILPPPHGYRDIYNQSQAAEKEYNIPSPPERERDVKPLTQEDVEMYSKKYEEMMSQYAQSEGYHSYISSECSSSSYVSSSSTPFLDLLRRESGELNQQYWAQDEALMDPNDPLFGLAAHLATLGGRESVTTVVTNSSSNSSGNDTLKCYGSASDISLGSSTNVNLRNSSGNNTNWDSRVPHSAKVPMPQKLHANKSPHSPTKSWSPPTSDMSSREINLKKFPLSTYTRPSSLPIDKQQQQQGQPEKLSPNGNTTNEASTTTPSSSAPVNGTSKLSNNSQSQTSSSPIIDTSKPPSVAERIWELEQKQSGGANNNNTSAVSKSTSNLAQSTQVTNSEKPSHTNTSSNHSSTSLPFIKSLPKISQSETLPLTSSIIQSIKSSKESVLGEINNSIVGSSGSSSGSATPPITATNSGTTKMETYKNLWNGSNSSVNGDVGNDGLALTPTSTSDNSPTNPTANSSPTSSIISYSSSNNQQIHYSYLDPEKKHKVADMTLKAIQKKALLSYYERHAGKNDNASQNHNQNNANKNQGDKVAGDKEDLTSERLGFTSKFSSSQLAGRDGVAGWNGSKSNLGGGAQAANLNNGGPSPPSQPNNAATTTTLTEEPASLPPERPPKKPHLRQFNAQMQDDGSDTNPPPPLPRAPNRPPATSVPVTASTVVSNGPPPPVPSKPALSVPVSTAALSLARSPSPELPPPPPPIVEEEVEVITNDQPLPPPPSLSEVTNCLGNRSRSAAVLSSYLHKDSYMAQRKERTLGYEGRYRRTLSPSGLGNNKSTPGGGGGSGGEPVSMGSAKMPPMSMTNATSTGKLDTSLTPSGWEKYHNIRPPSTTVIFTSHEIPKSPGSPTFHRSISCDSNLFNNKTGFTQSTIPPPVAQVAPLRDPYYHPHHHHNHLSRHPGSQSSFELEKVVEPFHQSSSSASSSSSSASSLTFSSSPIEESNGIPSRHRHHHHQLHPHPHHGMSGSDLALNLNHNGNYGRSSSMLKSISTSTEVDHSQDHVPNAPPPTINNSSKGLNSLPSVMVSPLQYSNSNKKGDDSGPPSPIKKSEVSLRVNCTSDVGSQTEEKKDGEKEKNEKCGTGIGSSPSKKCSSSSSSSSRSGSTTASSCSSSFDDSSTTSSKGGHSNGGPLSIISSYTGRQKTQEELECEELSRHLIKRLPQGDKLQKILVPLPEHKTTADYMEGLFQLELKLRPEKQEKETNTSPRSSPDLLQSLPKNEGGKNPQTPSPVPNNNEEGKGINDEDANEDSNKKCNGHAPLPADSPYFTTSECKAKFLTQYVNDMNNKSPLSKSHDSQELNQQKEMLVSRISRKLDILRTEQLEIREEIQSNEQLGQQVVEQVKQSAKRNEFDKFKLHVEEIEKITSLLLGLSGRLARAENALMSLVETSNPQDKKILESKRDKLREQLDEAKVLKENIDRRSAQVATFLQKYLTVEDYADYHHFVKMKAKLIIDAREIDDKIKLGEEQMIALKDTLNSSS